MYETLNTLTETSSCDYAYVKLFMPTHFTFL